MLQEAYKIKKMYAEKYIDFLDTLRYYRKKS